MSDDEWYREWYRFGSWPPEVGEKLLVWLANTGEVMPAVLRPDRTWRLGHDWYVQAMSSDRWRYDR